MEIPDNVNDWSRGLLVDLLDEGFDENELLEFKSIINTETKKIPITACAFANTNGGIMVFGIDNDRSKNISTDERLIGLDDSDQLKSQINNQIQRIEPSLPIENIIFRETNIKLPNGKVIVVMKILRSNSAPHQFNSVFYKRMANQNLPMDVNEIRNAFLESQKQKSTLAFLESQGSMLLDKLEAILLDANRGVYEKALNNIRHVNYDYFKHFMYNHVHYYSEDIQNSLFVLVTELERLERNEVPIRDRLETEDEKTAMANFKENVEYSIEELKKFSQLVGINLTEIKGSLKDQIKQEIEEMSEKIKSAKVEDVKKQEITNPS